MRQSQSVQIEVKDINIQSPSFSLWNAFSTWRVVMNGLAVVCFLSGIFMLEPILNNRLVSYGLSDIVIGLIFNLQVFVYVCCIPFLKYVPPKLDRRTLIGCFMFVNSICWVLIGPIWLLNKNIFMMCVGLGLMGVCLAMTIVPAIPDMAEGAKAKFPSVQ